MDLIKSATKVFSARLLGAFLTFGGLIYFTRVVGAAEIGIFFLFQALVGMSAIPANLGTRLAVEKRISEGVEQDRYLATGLLMKIVLLALVAGALLLLDEYLTEYLGADLTIALIVAIALKELADLMIAAIRGELRVGDTAVLDVSYQFGWVAVGGILTQFGYGLYALVVGLFSGYLLKLLWGFHRLSTSFGRPSLDHAVSLGRYGIYSVIPSVEGEVHKWMDTVLIGVFMTPTAVAAYEVAWRIGNAFLVLIQSIGETVFPQMSAWDSDGAHDQLERLIPQAITPALLLTIPAVGGAWLLSEQILTVVFGAEYAIAASALVLIIVAKIPRSIREVTGKALLGIGRADRMTLAAIVDITANLIFNVVLIQLFGLVGAALGTTLSLIVGTAVRWWYLSKDIHVTIDYRIAGWSIVGSIVMVIALGTVLTFVTVDGVISLLVSIILGVLFYSFFILLNDDIQIRLQDSIASLRQ